MMTNVQLFYIHDPMCSWCYAFSESLAGLQRDMPADIQMVYVLGGLAPDTTEPMPEGLRQTIQQNWRRIEQTVPHVRFNFDFWALNTPMRSTYPACRALLAARKQGMEYELKLLQAIQSAYYQQARNPSLASVLQECAAAVGLDEAMFSKDLISGLIDQQLLDEIQLARSMRVTSYPSLRLKRDNEIMSINIDYHDHQTMINQIRKLRKA
jgi:putative protein-disulfide isomerase